jgi:hypothetical protein
MLLLNNKIMKADELVFYTPSERAALAEKRRIEAQAEQAEFSNPFIEKLWKEFDKKQLM